MIIAFRNFLSSENKCADQLQRYCATDLRLFQICKIMFDHDSAHIVNRHAYVTDL